MKNKIIITLIIGIILIVCVTISTCLIINYKNDKVFQLETCVKEAKLTRDDLWNNNCDEQTDGSCTINSDSDAIKWIEQRYEQELEICYELYD